MYGLFVKEDSGKNILQVMEKQNLLRKRVLVRAKKLLHRLDYLLLLCYFSLRS